MKFGGYRRKAVGEIKLYRTLSCQTDSSHFKCIFPWGILYLFNVLIIQRIGIEKLKHSNESAIVFCVGSIKKGY